MDAQAANALLGILHNAGAISAKTTEMYTDKHLVITAQDVQALEELDNQLDAVRRTIEGRFRDSKEVQPMNDEHETLGWFLNPMSLVAQKQAREIEREVIARGIKHPKLSVSEIMTDEESYSSFVMFKIEEDEDWETGNEA